MLGNVFAPIAGVLIADYIFVKRGQIDLVGLFEQNGPYWYWNGVNPVAVIWTALGFLAYMFVIPAEWIRVMWTVIATGAGYWVTVEAAGAALCRARPGGTTGLGPARGDRGSRLGVGVALTRRFTNSPTARGLSLSVKVWRQAASGANLLALERRHRRSRR